MSPPKPHRRWLRYLLRGFVTLVVLLVIGVASLWRFIKQRAQLDPNIGPVISASRRADEDARLRALGLTPPSSGVLRERPFEPPWDSRSLIVPPAWFPQGIVAFAGYDLHVRADDLLLDLDMLEPVMQRAYGGWESAEARGWRWHEWFEDWRARLRAAQGRPLSLDEAFAPIDALDAYQRDNHTQIPLQRFFATSTPSRSLALAHLAQAPCTRVEMRSGATLALRDEDPAQRVRRVRAPTADHAQLEPVDYISLPSALGEPVVIVCGEERISLSACDRGPTSIVGMVLRESLHEVLSRDPPRIRRLSDDVVWARLPSFSPSIYEKVERDRPSWPPPNGHEKLLVVDLRGNGGGSLDFGLDVLKGWVDPSRLVKPDELGLEVGASCLYAPLKWNFEQVFLDLEPPVPAPVLHKLQSALDRLSAPALPDCPRRMTRTQARFGYRQHQVASTTASTTMMRILVLVDHGCGSDCEGLVVMLAALPETVVVGTNTMGLGEFSQPGFSVMPHTRLPFRMALGHSDLYGDGRSFDGYGFDVDVLLRSSADWDEAAIVKVATLLP